MRALLTLLAGLALIYVALGVALYLFQGSMVFLANLPGRALEATPADIGLDYENVHFDTADGERLHGWYIRAPDARGVLLFFHGNAGNISHRLESILIFNRLRLDVLIVDYRGYGQSTGRPSERGTYRDAQAAWDYLVRDRIVAPGNIVVFGRSLGGAVGAWLAAQLPAEEQPAAVIIESSFTSGADMARRLYPVYPARLLTRLKYPVIEFVGRLQCPVLVVHSRDDEIIPFTMGRAIYDAVGQPKDFIELRGDHNAGFWISREHYAAGLDAFLGKTL
ncbi:MAG: alpha/beta hydrolase [Xanthomonadales bacterium]|jgi:fermentation-respiration switch protein FrsA (DUF1100 family)|nr:alpha/beta hydrolase [Xanthomonadales bacterium]